jgi:hypothetical protein
MTIANWILLSIIIINTGLIILSWIKNFSILQKICECIMLPLFGAMDILILKEYLPDSLHLMKVTIITLALVTISTVFLSFEKVKILRILGRILVVLSVVCWITLYRSVFFIYKVPLWLTLLMGFIYLAGTITAIRWTAALTCPAR